MSDAAHDGLDKIEGEVFALYNKLRDQGMCPDCLAVRMSAYSFATALLIQCFDPDEDISNEERSERYVRLVQRVVNKGLELAKGYSEQNRT